MNKEKELIKSLLEEVDMKKALFYNGLKYMKINDSETELDKLQQRCLRNHCMLYWTLWRDPDLQDALEDRPEARKEWKKRRFFSVKKVLEEK